MFSSSMSTKFGEMQQDVVKFVQQCHLARKDTGQELAGQLLKCDWRKFLVVNSNGTEVASEGNNEEEVANCIIQQLFCAFRTCLIIQDVDSNSNLTVNDISQIKSEIDDYLESYEHKKNAEESKSNTTPLICTNISCLTTLCDDLILQEKNSNMKIPYKKTKNTLSKQIWQDISIPEYLMSHVDFARIILSNDDKEKEIGILILEKIILTLHILFDDKLEQRYQQESLTLLNELKDDKQTLNHAAPLNRLLSVVHCNVGLYFDMIHGKKELAFVHYKSSAIMGYFRAQFNLGVCYENGRGIDQNHVEAMKYYKLATDQGHAGAQFNLGACYQNGCGVEKNNIEAVKYYKLAADQGDSDAQNNLGVCYKNGEGVEKNNEEAVKYYKLAADQGHSIAQYNLASCYKNGRGVEKNNEEAVKYYKLAADQGHAEAQNNLASCYMNGEGVEKNNIEAVKYYKLSADQGNSIAQFNLGVCYWNGQGVEKNNEEAVKYCKLAADQGLAVATEALKRLETIDNARE